MDKDQRRPEETSNAPEQQRRQLADDLGFLMARHWLKQRRQQGRTPKGNTAGHGDAGSTQRSTARGQRG